MTVIRARQAGGPDDHLSVVVTIAGLSGASGGGLPCRRLSSHVADAHVSPFAAGASMFHEQLFGRVAHQSAFDNLDHGLSPARRGNQEALQEFVALLRTEALVQVSNAK